MGILDNLSGLVAGVAGPLLFKDAVLKRASARTLGAGGRISSTAETVNCKALRTEYSAFQRGQLAIAREERKILILGEGLANDPAQGDIVTIEGQGSWIVQDVTSDPARATFECRSAPAP